MKAVFRSRFSLNVFKGGAIPNDRGMIDKAAFLFDVIIVAYQSNFI